MGTLAIELNDAELRVARPGEVLAVEPGCVLFDGPRLAIGHDAQRSARLLPGQIHDRFWADLSSELLPRDFDLSSNFCLCRSRWSLSTRS